MSREVRVALLGYGCVGSAVDRLLHEQAEEIERATGTRLRVVRALVRDLGKTRSYHPQPGVLTTSFESIRDDFTIDLVAEVMGGLDPTERYVCELLSAGRPVATANKQLLARRGAALADVAAAAGLALRFEAAVCGAVPIVRTLCEGIPPGSVRRIVGIVNGTTNFLLTRMEEDCSFADALLEAQQLGYAEADPSEDLSGADAAAKIALLASLAFQRRVHFDEVELRGIEQLSPNVLSDARSLGSRIRLVAEAEATNGSVTVRVSPATLREDDPLAQVPAAFNEIALEGEGLGRLVLRGPGAGGPETATAVVSDLLALAAGNSCSHLARLGAPA